MLAPCVEPQHATMGCSSAVVRKAEELGSLIHSVLGDLLAIIYEEKKEKKNIYFGTCSELKHKILLLSNDMFSATGEGTSLCVLGVLMREAI